MLTSCWPGPLRPADSIGAPSYLFGARGGARPRHWSRGVRCSRTNRSAVPALPGAHPTDPPGVVLDSERLAVRTSPRPLDLALRSSAANRSHPRALVGEVVAEHNRGLLDPQARIGPRTGEILRRSRIQFMRASPRAGHLHSVTRGTCRSGAMVDDASTKPGLDAIDQRACRSVIATMIVRLAVANEPGAKPGEGCLDVE